MISSAPPASLPPPPDTMTLWVRMLNVLWIQSERKLMSSCRQSWVCKQREPLSEVSKFTGLAWINICPIVPFPLCPCVTLTTHPLQISIHASLSLLHSLSRSLSLSLTLSPLPFLFFFYCGYLCGAEIPSLTSEGLHNENIWAGRNKQPVFCLMLLYQSAHRLS